MSSVNSGQGPGQVQHKEDRPQPVNHTNPHQTYHRSSNPALIESVIVPLTSIPDTVCKQGFIETTQQALFPQLLEQWKLAVLFLDWECCLESTTDQRLAQFSPEMHWPHTLISLLRLFGSSHRLSWAPLSLYIHPRKKPTPHQAYFRCGVRPAPMSRRSSKLNSPQMSRTERSAWMWRKQSTRHGLPGSLLFNFPLLCGQPSLPTPIFLTKPTFNRL